MLPREANFKGSNSELREFCPESSRRRESGRWPGCKSTPRCCAVGQEFIFQVLCEQCHIKSKSRTPCLPDTSA